MGAKGYRSSRDIANAVGLNPGHPIRTTHDLEPAGQFETSTLTIVHTQIATKTPNRHTTKRESIGKWLRKRNGRPSIRTTLWPYQYASRFKRSEIQEDDDPPPLHTTAIEETFAAADAADYLEKVVGAIRERRLYGFMLQEQAESAVGAGQWIKQTIEEVVAEATAENAAVRLPYVQSIQSAT